MSTTKKYIATQGVGKFKAGQEVSGFSAERIKTFLKEGVIVDMADSEEEVTDEQKEACLLYTSPSPRDGLLSRMPSSA